MTREAGPGQDRFDMKCYPRKVDRGVTRQLTGHQDVTWSSPERERGFIILKHDSERPLQDYNYPGHSGTGLQHCREV